MKYDFKTALKAYQKLIDAEITDYVAAFKIQAAKDYGQRSLTAVDPYCAILASGGKRIRGSLVLVGYEIMGGTDRAMALQAARALEMMHTYILIVDDVQDRSNLRRGGPTAHRIIAAQPEAKHWKGDVEHISTALALNSALLGMHAAQMLLANLNVSDELRIKVINITNHTMSVTVHGQTNDLLNQVANDVTDDILKKVMQWKTAHYSFLNPLHVGMVLADAGCEDTNAITEYALNVGRAFQITDDLLMFIGEHDTSGKDPIEDVREGKQTLLTLYAAEHAAKADATFIQSCLGKKDISTHEFERFKQIIMDCGAVVHARLQAAEYVAAARASLAEHQNRWKPESVAFLDQLADYIVTRTH